MAPRRPFPTDPTLIAIAIAYRNSEITLIADDVMPRVPTDEEFKWMYYPLEQGFNIPDARVGRRGRPNQLEFEGEERDGSTDDFGYDFSIPYSDIKRAEKLRQAGMTGYDPRKIHTQRTTDTLLLQREVRVAGIVQNPANYAASRRLVLTGGDKFSAYGTSSPIDVIKHAISSTLVYRANTLTMGWDVWDKLNSHPDIVNAIRGTESGKGIVTKEEFAKLFDVKRVLVGESFVNVNPKGKAASLQRTWGGSIAALYIDRAIQSTDAITWGFTAQYGTRLAGTWEDKNVGLDGGEVGRVGEKVREIVPAPDVGFLIQGAV